jgi:hypothetical protein
LRLHGCLADIYKPFGRRCGRAGLMLSRLLGDAKGGQRTIKILLTLIFVSQRRPLCRDPYWFYFMG